MISIQLKVYVIIVSIVSFYSCSNNQPKGVIQFTTDIKEDASLAVVEQILESKKHSISEIRFEKGTYHFYPDKAKEHFVHVSNHNDELISTAFPLKALHNITIDGQGSEFIFHGRMIPFLIEGCTNVNIKNVSIDWAMSFHSEGLVVANNPSKGTFDLRISDTYPYVIRNKQIYFIKEYYDHCLGQSILFDTARKAIAFSTEFYTSLTNYQSIETQRYLDKINYKYPVDPREPGQVRTRIEHGMWVEEIEPGLVRFYGHRKKLPPVGYVLSTKGISSENRLTPAIRVLNTDGFEMSYVSIHHAGGMGLIAENSSDLILDHVQVTPSQGRMVATTADATHFVGCRGKVELKNCTFHNQLDDACNVHGTYKIVQDVLDEFRLGVRTGHFQQKGFPMGRKNDTLGLVRLSTSFFPYKKLTIKEITYLNGRYQIITFNEPIPEEVEIGDLLENLDAYPELLVENCNIKGNRARGLLLSTPRKTVIRNNFFSTEMEALLIPVESSFWYESGSVRNLIIEGNTFQDCNHSGLDRGVIRFETDDDNEHIAFENICIRNNTINHFDNLILEVSNTRNMVFENNIINQSETFPKLYPDQPAIIVEASEDIQFINNTYKGSAKRILQTENMTEELIFE